MTSRRAKSNLRETEEISSQKKKKTTGNKFSQMLSLKSKSSDDIEEPEQGASHNQPPDRTPIIILENQEIPQQINDVEMASQPNELETEQRNSLESPVNARVLQRRKSFEQMEIDEFNRDEFGGDEYFDNLENNESVTSRRPSQPIIKKSVAKAYLTKEEFDYTMKLFDTKINSIYKLCRYIGEKQNESSKDLKRLVALDELSEDFWNRAYREVVKKLLPATLFPTVSEFRKVLEDYLSERAGHFIESIGRNSWISMFEDKLLPEIRTKCRSKRNDIAASIRHAVFVNFGERLDHIDNNSSAAKIVEWKSSERTKAAYKALFSEGELLDTIGQAVFKQYRDKDLPTTHCAYIIAICDILLNPKSPGIKCNDKSVVKRVDALLRAFDNQTPITPEIMVRIAEEEAEAAATPKKTSSSQTTESEILAEDDDDYDNLISGLDQNF